MGWYAFQISLNQMFTNAFSSFVLMGMVFKKVQKDQRKMFIITQASSYLLCVSVKNLVSFFWTQDNFTP